MNKELKGIFIIIGNSIGAGLLGMPIICNLTGFIPSIIIMLFTALYMNITAKMIIQANFIYQLDNIIDLSEKVLGKKIKIISSIIFTLLFTTILSAYISKGGNLIQELILISTNLNQKTIKYFNY